MLDVGVVTYNIFEVGIVWVGVVVVSVVITFESTIVDTDVALAVSVVLYVLVVALLRLVVV